MPCSGVWRYFELLRFGAALRAGMNGDETRAEEADRLLALGCERLVNGWTDTDKVALDKQDRDKKQVLWDLMKTLGHLATGATWILAASTCWTLLKPRSSSLRRSPEGHVRQ